MDWMHHAIRNWFRVHKHSRQFGLPRLRVEILEDRVAPASNLTSLLALNQIQTAFPSANGAGSTVALLDTGINYNLPSLGGGIGSGYRVVYGHDFIDNTGNNLDDNGHGTFLANLIGSSAPGDLGIAPKVNFADLKVLSSELNGPFTAIDQALKWVIANKAQYNIVGVNMSFGSGNYTADQFSLLESDLTTLKNMGVFIAAASGNNYVADGSKPGLSYPAADPDVVSVGATWAGSYGAQTLNGATDKSTSLNQFADFTQRDSALSILAPGAWLTTIGMNGSETTMGGTSVATAVVTGAAVLLDQVLDQAGESARTSEQDVLQLMQSTGTSVVDDAGSVTTNVKTTGLTFKELNLLAALNAVAPITPLALGTIPDQTMFVGQTINVALPISRAATDPVTFSTQVVYLPALAYQLKQQYGLNSSGSYHTNEDGFNEKWLTGAAGASYWLMPNGALYRYAGSRSSTLLPTNLVGTLNASYYANPALLWNAPYAANPPTVLSVSGTTLSILSSVFWVGTYNVVVTATDAKNRTVATSFNVTLTYTAPQLAAIAPKAMAAGQTSLTVPLTVSDPDGGALTYGAVAETSNTAAFQLNQQYGFYEYDGSYYVNLRGQSEKWLLGKNNDWYMLLPTGQLYRWVQSMAATLKPANLIATLSPAIYADPRLLWNAQPPAPPALTFSFAGNQLTIRRPASLTGAFFIDVYVSDGFTTKKQSFEVVLN